MYWIPDQTQESCSCHVVAEHPSYRLHNARKCGVVTIADIDHYLGPCNSSESLEKYDRLLAFHSPS